MARKKPPELLPGTLDLMILKTLTVGPNHGYGIAQHIKQTSDDVLHVEEGSLYPALHRLAKRGYLEFEWGNSESNRRAKYYRLTRKGRSKLKVGTNNWAQLTAAIDKVMSARKAGKVATKGGI